MIEFPDVVDVLLVPEPPADLNMVLFAKDFDQRRCPAASAYYGNFSMI